MLRSVAEVTYLNKQKLSSINGLRGIAILVVIYQHGLSEFVIEQSGFYYIIGNGLFGVNLFFILSGFVLYKPYLLKDRNFKGLSDYKEYYANRFNRLYPLFIFICLISFTFVAKPSMDSLRSLFLTLSTLSMLSYSEFFPSINVVLWSLNVEIWFSILFPLLIYILNRIGFVYLTVLIFLLAFLLRMVGAYFPYENLHLNPVKDFFLARLDDFFLGMILCKLYYSGYCYKINSTVFSLLAILFTLIGFYLWDLRVITNSLPIYVVPLLNNVLQIGFFCLMVATLKPGSAFNIFFSNKLLQLMGLMCFSLYVWHNILIPLFIKKTSVLSFVLSFILYSIILLALSSFTYRFIEFRKVNSIKKLFLYK